MSDRELMDDVHKALTERGWECGDDNDGGVMCFDIARYLLEVGWRHPDTERLGWKPAPEGRPWEEHRAGLSWDQIDDAISKHLCAYPSPDHSTDWIACADGAADEIWNLLAPGEVTT